MHQIKKSDGDRTRSALTSTAERKAAMVNTRVKRSNANETSVLIGDPEPADLLARATIEAHLFARATADFSAPPVMV